MKLFSLSILLIVFSSCKNKVDFNLLVGSWKLRDVFDDTGMNFSDKFTFFNNDSLSIDILSNGKMTKQFSGKYKIDRKTNQLKIIFLDKTLDYKIIKLTSTELELQNQAGKLIDRYRRF